VGDDVIKAWVARELGGGEGGGGVLKNLDEAQRKVERCALALCGDDGGIHAYCHHVVTCGMPIYNVLMLVYMYIPDIFIENVFSYQPTRPFPAPHVGTMGRLIAHGRSRDLGEPQGAP
jgi:hypothetical protein